MIYKLFGFDYIFDLKFFQLVFLCAILGLFSKYLIQIINKDYFVTGMNQILVFALLPATGFIITSAISNNIALSLGMVGALSIVRFRTPVKNPLELVIYFYLITIGIVTSVNPNIAVNFSVFLACATFLTELYIKLIKKISPSKIMNQDYKYFLRVECKVEIQEFDSSQNLIHKSFDSKSYLYNFGFINKEFANEMLLNIDKEFILNYSIDIPN